jgi:hypothetical protein
MTRTLALLLTIAAAAAPAIARDDPAFRQVAAGEVVTLRPDRAYVLLRVKKSVHAGWISPTFLRVPAAAEVEAFEALRRAAHAKAGSRAGPYEEFAFQDKNFGNFYGVNLGRTVAETETLRTVLLDLSPGTYVLVGNGMRRGMWTCFCLGTVQFTVAAGQLADGGTFFGEMASKPSAEPELAAVTNRGAMAQLDFASMAGAVRPYRQDDPVPPSLAALPRNPADYRAVGAFVLREALLVNYLAPVPGVLDYRRGEVFDVKSGQIVPPR